MKYFVTTSEIRLARRVCRRASMVGLKLGEEITLAGSRFTWLLPDGEQLPGTTTGPRDLALVGACRDLCRQFHRFGAA